MKRRIKFMSFDDDRKSVTITFNKRYSHLGLGPLQLVKYLLKWAEVK